MSDPSLQRLIRSNAGLVRRIVPRALDGVAIGLFIDRCANKRLIIDAPDPLQPGPCGKLRCDQFGLAFPRQLRLQLGHEFVCQALIDPAFGIGQAEPLHRCRCRFSGGQEHQRETASLRS